MRLYCRSSYQTTNKKKKNIDMRKNNPKQQNQNMKQQHHSSIKAQTDYIIAIRLKMNISKTKIMCKRNHPLESKCFISLGTSF